MDEKKVLLIRLSSLGDVALLSPVIAILHSRNYKIHLLTRRLPANIYLGDPRVERIWIYEDYSPPKLIYELMREKYSYICDLHLQPRTILLTSFLRTSSKVITYHKESIQRYSLLFFKRRIFPLHHTIYRYLTAIKFAGSVEELWEEAKRNLVMPFFEEEVEELWEELKLKNIYPGKNIIFLAPGARWETKRWPPEYYRKLAELLSNEGITVGIVGGTEDSHLAKEILKTVGGYDFTGIPPRKTILLLSYGKGLITNDSAHLHFGMLAGIPVIAIFGPTVPDFGFYPLGKKDIILETDLPCRPCSMHGEKRCKRGDLLCLKMITPEQVFTRVKEEIIER